MILADKIIEERKKLGLSQEELAEKLNVSRQAVSKWESAQSVPDLQKILAMSDLFSVSTDYLLKDEMEPEKKQDPVPESKPEKPLRRVSMEEANDFMNVTKETTRKIALGVFLCILSPALLIFLSGLSEAAIGISETVAAAIGLSVLLLLVAGAVYLFIRCTLKTEKFRYLERAPFETAYGVSGLVKEKEAAFEPTYTGFLSLGIMLCVLSPLPLLIAALVSDADVLAVSMTSLLLAIVAVGTYFIIRATQMKAAYRLLLGEEDALRIKRKKNRLVEAVSSTYWCLAVAIYLGWSFLSGAWNISWILWPIAGVLFGPFILIVKQIAGVEDDENG